MQNLLQKQIFPALQSDWLKAPHDGALLAEGLAFTTDSYVVSPLEFPGGDIGSLAVFGTVNDLAMCGARPRWLSLALILEEGLPLEQLQRILHSIQQAAGRCQVEIVTGDTKTVERGKGDGLFITTTGLGTLLSTPPPHPSRIQTGDAILINGDLGRHGLAVLAQRQKLELEGPLFSDCAPVHAEVEALLQAGIELRCLRDPTRGGVASVLHELAQASGLSFQLEETCLPLHEEVQAVCEILGFDPLYLANEGKFLAFVPAPQAEAALQILKHFNSEAAQIGAVTQASPTPTVNLKSPWGTTRTLDLLSGEQLPRIC